jgi:hypothetical protein
MTTKHKEIKDQDYRFNDKIKKNMINKSYELKLEIKTLRSNMK